MDDALGLQQAKTSQHLAGESFNQRQRETSKVVGSDQLVEIDAEAW